MAFRYWPYPYLHLTLLFLFPFFNFLSSFWNFSPQAHSIHFWNKEKYDNPLSQIQLEGRKPATQHKVCPPREYSPPARITPAFLSPMPTSHLRKVMRVEYQTLPGKLAGIKFVSSNFLSFSHFLSSINSGLQLSFTNRKKEKLLIKITI